MATASLIGNNNVETGSSALQRVRYCGFIAQTSGRVTEIRVYGHAAGNVKVAIYADNSTWPGNRLVCNDTPQAIAASQWNTLSIPELSVTQGTKYWLAIATDGSSGLRGNTSGGLQAYKTITFSSYSWPDPADSGLSTNGWIFSIAGWGVLVITGSGISQAISLGSPTLQQAVAPKTLSPGGIAQAVALGSPAVQKATPPITISPAAIPQALALGSPKLSFTLKPTGIPQAQALGSPALIKKLQFVAPSGISQALAYGTPKLITEQFISPAGIAQAVAFGTAAVGIYGIIGPSGIAQVIAIGSPAVLKYVWHVILDGEYSTETPRTNRAYVIGRDQHGNPVYGTAVDATEPGLVGERLDFHQELAIPTEALAEDMAEAVLAKMRLSGTRGVILIPPNCGQELFDVVQITDSGANQSAAKLRVVGIRFEYSPKQARYQHRLILGAP